MVVRGDHRLVETSAELTAVGRRRGLTEHLRAQTGDVEVNSTSIDRGLEIELPEHLGERERGKQEEEPGEARERINRAEWERASRDGRRSAG